MASSEAPAAAEGQDVAVDKSLEKTFGYSKNIGAKYELGEEIGRGHFGHTCRAKIKKGELKGQPVAVKVISKVKVRDSDSLQFRLRRSFLSLAFCSFLLSRAPLSQSLCHFCAPFDLWVV